MVGHPAFGRPEGSLAQTLTVSFVIETTRSHYASIRSRTPHRTRSYPPLRRRTNANMARWGWGLFAWIGYSFLLFTIYLPVSHNEFRGWFMALVVAVILARIIRNHGKIGLHPSTFHWILFYFVAGTAFVTLSYLRDAPGALFSSLVFIVWPLVYALMIEAVAQPARIVNVLRVLTLAMIAIGLGTVYFLAWTLGWVPDSIYIDPQLVDHVAFFGTSMQMSHLSISCLIFLIPFTISSLYVYSPKTPRFLPPWVICLALSFGLFTAFVGGRRGLFLVLLTTPALALFFHSWLPERLRPPPFRRILLTAPLVLALLGIGLYLGKTTGWSWGGTWDLFLTGFQFRSDPSANARLTQFIALTQAWKTHPLFGAGLGVGVPGVIRSATRPWEYELQYVLLLYQIGVVGIIIYGAGLAWIYYRARKMARSGSALGVHIVPVLVGMTSFLIADATNPYLPTFGHLWTLFLPVAMINSSSLFEPFRASTSSRPFKDFSN